MKYLIILSILVSVTSTASLNKSPVVGKYENGVISSVALTYKHPQKNKTINIVGVMHTGTKAYYERLGEFLKNLKEGTVLLEEFTRCESKETLVLDMKQCDEQTVQKAWDKSLFPSTLKKMVNIKPKEINQMIESGFLAYKKCESDPVSQIPRPSSIIERNKQRCERAISEGIVCQHDMYDTLRPSNITPIHSDVLLRDNNKGEHLLASLLYSYVREDGCSKGDIMNSLFNNPEIGDNAYTLNKTIKHFILTHRDRILLKTLFKALEVNDSVATLWGELHNIAIDKKLKEEGYILTKLHKIHYMNDKEGSSWVGYQGLIDSLDYNPYNDLK